MHVFIDESGDLGFSEKASNFFVASYVIPKQPWVVRNRLKRVLTRLHKRREYSGSELKFSNSNHEVRIYVLQKICQTDWSTGIIVVEKKKVKKELRKMPNILYNYSIVHNLMRNILLWLETHEKLALCIDKSLSQSNIDAFDLYVKDKASWLWNVELGRTPYLKRGQIEINHKDSCSENCLQLADYIAGATFQKYERGIDDYYRMFENNVRAFNYLW